MQKRCPFCKRFIKAGTNFHEGCFSSRASSLGDFIVGKLGISHEDAVPVANRIVSLWASDPERFGTYEESLETFDFEEIYQHVHKKNSNRNQKPKQVVMDMRGGAREGAGRKRKGTRKPVSINLPDEEWRKIHEKIASGEVKGLSDYFVNLHLEGAHVHS